MFSEANCFVGCFLAGSGGTTVAVQHNNARRRSESKKTMIFVKTLSGTCPFYPNNYSPAQGATGVSNSVNVIISFTANVQVTQTLSLPMPAYY